VPKHHAVKTYGEVGIKLLGNCWRQMVSFTPRPLYPVTHWIGLFVVANRKLAEPAGGRTWRVLSLKSQPAGLEDSCKFVE